MKSLSFFTIVPSYALSRNVGFCSAALAAALLLPLLGASQGMAQVDTHAAVQRYNRVAKGSNVDEWHRRIFDEDVKTRLDAVNSLGSDASEDSVKPLLDATADPDPRVRAKAIDYLGMIGDRQATPLLTQYLFMSDIDDPSKRRVLAALGRIGDPESVDDLQVFARKTDSSELRCAALHALGEVGHPAAMPLVKEYATGEGSAEHLEVARVASDALKKIERKSLEQPDRQPTIIQLEKAFRPPQQ